MASVQPGNLRFTINDFASGRVIGGRSGDEGGGDLVSVVEQFDCTPRSNWVGGGQDDTGKGCGDLWIAQNCGDSIFAEKSVSEFKDDDIGRALSELVDQGFGEVSGVVRLRCDNAKVGENGDRGGSGILHGENVAAEGDAGGFGGRNFEAPTNELLDDCEAGFSFAGIHTSTDDGDDGGEIALKFGLQRGSICGDVGGNALAGVEGGEAENAPEDFALMGWANEGRVTGANAEDSAHIEEVYGVSSFERFWDMSGIALEGISMPQCSGNDVALFKSGHSTSGEFEGVVGGLACEDADGDDVAFSAGVFVADSDISAEGSILGDAGDFVEDEGSHGFTSGLARAWRIPARP